MGWVMNQDEFHHITMCISVSTTSDDISRSALTFRLAQCTMVEEHGRSTCNALLHPSISPPNFDSTGCGLRALVYSFRRERSVLRQYKSLRSNGLLPHFTFTFRYKSILTLSTNSLVLSFCFSSSFVAPCTSRRSFPSFSRSLP